MAFQLAALPVEVRYLIYELLDPSNTNNLARTSKSFNREVNPFLYKRFSLRKDAISWATSGRKKGTLNLCLENIPQIPTAIIQSAFNDCDDLSMIKRLLEKLPSISPAEKLRSACRQGQMNIVEFLISKSFPENFDYLVYLACLGHHIELVDFLLKTASFHRKKIFVTALKEESVVEEIRELLSNAEGSASRLDSHHKLLSACSEGNREEVERLCRSGVSPNIENIYGESPIEIATWRGHAAIVRTLIEYGAKPKDYWEKLIGYVVAEIETHRAQPGLVDQCLEILEILLRDGGRGQRGLAYCAVFGLPRVLQVLLDYGVSINERINNRGQSALHTAARRGHGECVKLLLNAGALIYADYEGRTAIDYSDSQLQSIFSSHNLERKESVCSPK